MKLSLIRPAAAAAALLWVPGCFSTAASDGAADVDVAADDLSTTRILDLGEIAPGAAVDVAYKAQPKYRAFDFDGAKNVDATFTVSAANGAGVRLYVLAADSRQLKATNTGTITYRPSATGKFQIALATLDGSATSVHLAMKAPPPAPVDAPPLASCNGDITPAEALAAANAGPWFTLIHRAYTRRCDEQPAKTCTPWTPNDGLVLPTPNQGSTSSLFGPLVTTIAAQSGGIILRAANQGQTLRGEAKIETSSGISSVTLNLTYQVGVVVCDDYSPGAGWGSGGCMSSHVDYHDAILGPIAGSISESCAHLTNGVEVSDIQDFGGGVRSYIETTHYWLAN